MPEYTVVQSFVKEINRYSVIQGSSGKPYDHPDEFGTLVFHKACCARADGNRQTVSFHQPSESENGLFISLPTASGTRARCECSNGSVYETFTVKTHSPSSSLKHSVNPNEELPSHYAGLKNRAGADIANALGIKGTLHATGRGKEIVLGIGRHVIRVCYHLEAHSFWMPTSLYRQVTEQAVVKRGEKSHAFPLGPDFYSDGRKEGGKLSIQAAFIRPDWTLVFCDHNVMITFHIFELATPFQCSLFNVGSSQWRREAIEKHDTTPLFIAVKSNQRVFNGYDAQETCDMLYDGFFPPHMPVFLVCGHDTLWPSFKTHVEAFQLSRSQLLDTVPLPMVSGILPFHFNADGHRRFLTNFVTCYRRRYIYVDCVRLQKMQDLGYLTHPSLQLDDDGQATIVPKLRGAFEHADNDHEGEAMAIVPITSEVAYRPPKSVRPGLKHVKLQNFQIVLPSTLTGSKPVNTYSPFLCLPHDKAWVIKGWFMVQKDVGEELSLTTLGPYSFHIFVTSNLTLAKLPDIPIGRRPLQIANHSNRKRKSATDLQKESSNTKGAKRPRVSHTSENVPVDTSVGRRLRSHKLLI
ncbi:hypothetical protein CVT24_007466 [Panaeolus cyanescens]|uniref:Uncharacterized protein n=1 Tax=Panaeolus cyanescens TaxID=181874 RepID=A0A409YR33_9AGAR|nr:hypothetical protein CVT24_007466 [Panaeolus cyanescens]